MTSQRSGRRAIIVLSKQACPSCHWLNSELNLHLNYTCRATGVQRVQLNDEAEEFRWVSVEEAARLSLNTPTRILLDAVQIIAP